MQCRLEDQARHGAWPLPPGAGCPTKLVCTLNHASSFWPKVSMAGCCHSAISGKERFQNGATCQTSPRVNSRSLQCSSGACCTLLTIAVLLACTHPAAEQHKDAARQMHSHRVWQGSETTACWLQHCSLPVRSGSQQRSSQTWMAAPNANTSVLDPGSICEHLLDLP